MTKLRLIKVKKPPKTGKQQGCNVNPGLAGANGQPFFHHRSLHPSPSKDGSHQRACSLAHSPPSHLEAGCSCLELTSLWPSYYHALTCANSQNYITNLFFFISWTCLPWYSLKLTKTFLSSLSNWMRPWSSLKKKYPAISDTVLTSTFISSLSV